MRSVGIALVIILVQGIAACAQTRGSTSDRTMERLATSEMIQQTWDINGRNASLADELALSPGGPIIAVMRAGFMKWGAAEFGKGDNAFWIKTGKDHADYALQIGLIKLRIEEEAHTRSVLRKNPDLAKGDRDERIKFNAALAPADVALIVAAASKLDSALVASWLAARDAVKKNISELLASKPELLADLADTAESDAEIQKSRAQLSRLIATAGWKGK